MMKQVIQTNNAPQAIGPYSQAIMAGDTLYVSGQIPVVPATGAIVSDKVEDQARQVMENVKAVVEAAGLTLDHVVKTSPGLCGSCPSAKRCTAGNGSHCRAVMF